jgi:hypothetical protein
VTPVVLRTGSANLSAFVHHHLQGSEVRRTTQRDDSMLHAAWLIVWETIKCVVMVTEYIAWELTSFDSDVEKELLSVCCYWVLQLSPTKCKGSVKKA